ncbi:MAG: phospho-N-acetylmuramoyl-pentapeptide-transferase, phospho-N-acetylmuramoyl-pentapeptide-transferase [Candidatus Parcubacteria bacterium]|jgi:phospho-N-acetylmuramoyl-pentapeptide-transferase
MIFNVIKILTPAIVSFIVGLALTPSLTNYMYRKKMWKNSSRSKENQDAMSADFKKIHNERGEKSTPRVGGILVWLSVLLTILIIAITSFIYPTLVTQKLNFLSTNQTILPLFALIFASLIGLVDDLLQIYGKGLNMSDGISRKMRILVVLLIGAVGAWWFYFKLGTLSINIPFGAPIDLGMLFIPFFMLVVLGVFSGSVIDGIDGLAAGVMASAFAAYSVIAFAQLQIDIAAFCAVIVGGLLAFLWFNIPPARFYLGETGMLGLTVTLAIVAFLTEQVVLLPLIAFPLFITSASSSLQMFSKKYFGKKIFKIAPLHHHFEALGWPSYKVTMRYWVISIICALFGVIIALIG